MVLTVAMAAAAPVAVRSVGLIIDSSPVEHAVPFVRFSDVLVETLSASRRWEPTVLQPDSPIVRIGGAAWPQPVKGEWMANPEALTALLVTTRLDDLLVVKPLPAATNDLEILWLRTGEAEIRRLHIATVGAGDQAYIALSQQLIARLDEGPRTAMIAARMVVPGSAPAPPTTTPSTPPATPPPTITTPPVAKPPVAAPPTTPGAPATATGPATGGAVSVGHDTQPADAPRPTAGTTAPTVDLTKPTPGASVPGATPGPPQAPATQPATGAPAPQAPTAPTPPAPTPTAPPTAPAETPPTAPPTAPQGPSVYLTAAQKYLQEGDYRKVEDMLLQAQGAGDARATIYYTWAELEKARHNPAAERTWLERTIAADPAVMPAHLRLAELLRQAGLWHKAVDEYEIVIKAEPANLHAYLGLSAVYAGKSQPRRAAEIMAEAVKHYPQDPTLYLRLGDLHAQRQAWAEAENAYDTAARLTEGTRRGEALDRLGDLYVSAGREREGFICYAEASKLRAGAGSTIAEKRYLQIMTAADQALLKAGARAREALQAHLSGQDVYREDVWVAFNDLRMQIRDFSAFADGVVPPASMKLAHAEHRLAYSLAAEAALAVLQYLDEGDPSQLRVYSERMDEATRMLERLQSVAVTKGARRELLPYCS
jgi:tetratricopeptide (TPR) repeat protein